MKNTNGKKKEIRDSVFKSFDIDTSSDAQESSMLVPAAVATAKLGLMYMNNSDEIKSYASNALKAAKHQIDNSEVGINVNFVNFCKRRHMRYDELPNYIKRIIIVALNKKDEDAILYALHRKIRHEEIIVDMGSADHWFKDKVSLPIRFYIRPNSAAMTDIIDCISQDTTSEYMQQRLRFFAGGSFIAEFSILNGQILNIYKG